MSIFVRRLLGVLLPSDDEWGSLATAEVAEYVGPRYDDTSQLDSMRQRIERAETAGRPAPQVVQH